MSHTTREVSLWKEAAAELEVMRSLSDEEDHSECRDDDSSSSSFVATRFPRSCMDAVRSLPGNRHCVDCGAAHPTWASVSYGCLLCLQCSGRHRSYGVAVSTVRSLDMDHWTHVQILNMLEGGNAQLKTFYQRHNMGDLEQRYHTKAAVFYRSHLAKHAQGLARKVYPGREAVRQRSLGAKSCRISS